MRVIKDSILPASYMSVSLLVRSFRVRVKGLCKISQKGPTSTSRLRAMVLNLGLNSQTGYKGYRLDVAWVTNSPPFYFCSLTGQ